MQLSQSGDISIMALLRTSATDVRKIWFVTNAGSGIPTRPRLALTREHSEHLESAEIPIVSFPVLRGRLKKLNSN